MTPSGAGLVIEGLWHSYGKLSAVENVSLAVGPGEVVALLGPSGCGKSTVLRLAAGLETLLRGRIAVGGREVAAPGRALPPEARSVGMMFQDFALFPHLTVARNAAFGLRRLAPAARRLAARAALERVGLAARAGDYPHMLSGGEQQRAALARALAPAPRAMLLDEPFSSLDPALRDRVRDAALDILREAGAPVLMVTHDPREAMLAADRIAFMHGGRIRQQGPPETLYRAPADALCATFLGEAQRFDGVARGGRADTPLGAVAAPGIPDGAPVEILIRPEGVRLGAEAGAPAVVRAVRGLGAGALSVLALDGGAEARAWTPWADAPAAGSRVRAAVGGELAFVFPARGR